MNDDLVMLEASLFQLRTAIASIEDETTLPQLELTVSVLANAAATAHAALNAARVNDIEFALNDVAGVADSLSSDDAAAIAPAIDMLRADVDVLKEATAALASGGLLCGFLPTTGQVQQLVLSLGDHGFVEVETFEILHRAWHVTERSVRPDHRMVAHTGFITVARLGAPREG